MVLRSSISHAVKNIAHEIENIAHDVGTLESTIISTFLRMLFMFVSRWEETVIFSSLHLLLLSFF